ncbi:helix-hairpin-helix domain-containing protein [Radiobacillus kanasensis]|uniref:helix-hairpin-helix domain-containing protein n=1 Tax=Radiobacillus kanasensis TaxID=2844358 RepID=UPI002EDB64B7
MSNKRPKLPLSQEEKQKLRYHKIKISDFNKLGLTNIIDILEVSEERSKILKGLADFQVVPSIGIKLAEKLVFKLELYSLDDIKSKDGAELLDQLEEKLGVWTDPCVEDQIRCVIYYANTFRVDKQWFDFTEERKRYRETYGYPGSRPKMAWYE